MVHVSILSPAKLNLMLRILGQRSDGYHLLQTYFQLLNWGDEMEFTLQKKDSTTITGNFGNLSANDNLIYKAAQLLLPYRQSIKGIHIHVEKNIPQGSGLGGGSSNAGTTLRILNEIWNCRLPQEELQKLAIKLGADVPVFVLNQSAMAYGIGEKLTTFAIQNHYYVLIFPKTSIATIDVFQDENLNRNQQAIEISKIAIKSNWTNACLPVVLDTYCELKNKYAQSSKLAKTYISGTGSTLFTCFNTQASAELYIQQCPDDWNTLICQSKINE